MILDLGTIDDVDRVYLDGRLIGGKGESSPEILTAYNIRRRVYSIPSDRVRWGAENILAVRVYDVWGQGGIYQGPVQIITQKEFDGQRKADDWNDRDWDDGGESFWDVMGSIFDDWF